MVFRERQVIRSATFWAAAALPLPRGLVCDHHVPKKFQQNLARSGRDWKGSHE